MIGVSYDFRGMVSKLGKEVNGEGGEPGLPLPAYP